MPRMIGSNAGLNITGAKGASSPVGTPGAMARRPGKTGQAQEEEEEEEEPEC